RGVHALVRDLDVERIAALQRGAERGGDQPHGGLGRLAEVAPVVPAPLLEHAGLAGPLAAVVREKSDDHVVPEASAAGHRHLVNTAPWQGDDERFATADCQCRSAAPGLVRPPRWHLTGIPPGARATRFPRS